MKIEMRAPGAITPYPNNPRKNDSAVDAVADSIQRFGFRQPIVVDSEDVIVVGHTRWKAAQRLGLEQVPVHVAHELTEEQARAYRIADNKTPELAAWDPELLSVELGALQHIGIDWGKLGFDSDELIKLLNPGAAAGLTDPDSIPEPPDEPVTQRGDLIALGEHRLLCADSACAADVDRLLDGATIHLLNTDPPYNVKVEPRSNNAIAAGNSSFAPSKKSAHHQKFDLARHPEKAKGTTKQMRAKDRPLENDFVSDEDFGRMLRAWFGNAARVLEPGRGFYIWGGYANVANYPSALKENGLYFSQTIIWDKQHPVLTRKDFMGAHEWCQPAEALVLTADGPTPIASLRDGDQVISFKTNTSTLTSRRESVPVTRTERPYKGAMLHVAAGDRQTRCTPGHIWSIKLAPEATNLWCVYVMKRGRWWRIGKSKLLSTWGFGVKHRLKTEDGEAAWILSVHESNLEAALHEQACQARYGIPTTTWAETYCSRRTIVDVARLYDQLDLNVLEQGALRALADHGRELEHPFLSRSTCRPKIGRRVPVKARACNLLPGVMLIPTPLGDGTSEVPWSPIRSVEREAFEGHVYSLDVPGLHHYVADGLVTHNCFYGWREGAAHVYLGPNNETDLWAVKKVNPQSMIHLTEKPVELASRALQYSSRPGENVLDLFGGSGSTLIAAEQTGRRAYLMEIDAAYCDVICGRYEAFTGKKAQRPTPHTPDSETAPAIAEAGSDGS